MSKKISKLEFHPSVTIAYCEEGSKKGTLLTAIYDSGYRMKAYVGSANPIGGNPSRKKGDRNPQGTIVREISEEYDPAFQGPNHDALVFGQKVDWALPEDIRLVSGSLVNKIQSWRDFYVEFRGQIKKGDLLGDPAGCGIYSVFLSSIPSEIIECVERNIAQGKTLSNEGNIGVFYLDKLIKNELGEFSVAHAAAPIFNEYFGVKIPFPEEVVVESLKTAPRILFTDYLNDFEYSKTRPNSGKPSFHEVVFGATE